MSPADNDRPQDRHGDPPDDQRPVPADDPANDVPVDPMVDAAADVPTAEPEPAGTHRQNRREATGHASTARSESREPSNVDSEVGAPAGPISFVRRREIEAVHDEIELTTGDAARTLVGVKKYREALFANYFRARAPFVVTWPDNLYIPADADYRTYWSSPAPDDHRFRYRWANGRDGQPDGSDASEKTGRLFSWVNASAMDSGDIGFAGTGVTLVPRASLSSVTVTASVDLVAESRWWFLPAGPIGFAAFSYRGTAYVAGWEIDPITGAWELLSPFGSRTLFAFDESGKGGSAISSQRHAFTDLSVTLQLRGSRTYAIGVALEAQISLECRDKSGTPYRPQPGDDVKLWASIAGMVPSITLAT
ncbi:MULTISPECIES: hypothetical protein [Cryobacterium]|uniref:hypothetical protein n=1 Tax=Cryobacterium TaxID=69578 RepID=UPI000CD45F2C|nr:MULTISPECIES: hypothetical protein [Cryobacterium]POH65524.1 hypothetical protein C3B60_11505 [Cryobacterium zongtaii]TFC45225.1 hypothetical protein E3O57_08840 [Cryobacterium sp. TMN-39-2]